MCAIAGVIGRTMEDQIINRMLSTMERRGPDGKGIYRNKQCTLLHTRLAIIDIAGGAQPMQLNMDGVNYWISYNGELYNTEELRSQLRDLGHTFRGHSDTEVLLHGYIQWKEKILEKVNGIFAFAVWEDETQKLFFARDRMGVKPFFYTIKDGVFVFASEIKTILASGVIAPRLDHEGAMQLLMLGPGRKPGSGVFRDVYELEPGFCGTYCQEKLLISQYWKLEDRIHTDTFEETAERVRWIVTDAIKRQMVSDVPIGTFLSGGLDSSLITAICAGKSSNPLPTFSVDYENNDKYFVPGKFQPNSDGEYIEFMKNTFETTHQFTVLTPEDLLTALESATVARDLPGMADVDFSLFAFCSNIRKNVKVALSGECADEIFGGYPWYRDPEVRAVDGFPWAQNTSYRAMFLQIDKKTCEEYVHQCYIDSIRKADILPENSNEERRVKEMVNLNVRWFMQTLLDRKDRMSMYHGLEVRVPFCDHRIAEYMYSVPWSFKDYKGREKGLLRYAMEGVLPEKVLYRKKSPYPKTFDPRYEELVTERMKDLLRTKDSPLFQLVDRKAVESLLALQMPWPWYGQLMRRPQTVAYLLQLDYWLREYHVNLI